jgi:hypothetical protein
MGNQSAECGNGEILTFRGEECVEQPGEFGVRRDLWKRKGSIHLLGVYWTCIGRCMDSSQGNRYVYWTMAWSTVTSFGLNSHQR